jgi:hypothetical protein
MVRRELLLKHHSHFIPGRIHEDVLWVTKVLLYAQAFAYDSQPGYYYRQRPGSLSKPMTDAALIKIIYSTVANAYDLAHLLHTEKLLPATRSVLASSLVGGACSVFHKIAKIQDKIQRKNTIIWLKQAGFFELIWPYAAWGYKRRIARYFISYSLFK